MINKHYIDILIDLHLDIQLIIKLILDFNKMIWLSLKNWIGTLFHAVLLMKNWHWFMWWHHERNTVYPKKYAHGFVVLCFVVVMQSFIINSHEVFIHIHQGCFAGTGAIVRLPQCQWSKPDGYGNISQCITTTKHSKAKTVCIFLGKYCNQMQLNSVSKW